MSEFSRKTFVKGGGALIVGFSLAGLAGKARAADSPFASNGPFDQYQVDSWITINADNTASIKSGAISQGTGSITGILQIAAEELGMEFGQVVHVKSDTNVTPETGTKAASNTITNAGPGVRAATAWARQTLLGLASTQLGVPATQLSVTKGVVSGGGRTVTYGQLLGGKLFNVRMPDSYDMTARGTGVCDFTGGIQPGVAPAKPISQYTLVGTRVPSIEIPPIVTGTATYVDNVRIPGMLHGRVVLPRGQSVFGFGAPVVSVDEKSISHIKRGPRRTQGRLRRHRGAARVRRDPGGRAAEGEVGRPAEDAARRRRRVRGDAGNRSRRSVSRRSTWAVRTERVSTTRPRKPQR
jgi:hypothetical protein